MRQISADNVTYLKMAALKKEGTMRKVGKACILNNIFEIDVFVYEKILEQRLAQIKEQHGLITNSGIP